MLDLDMLLEGVNEEGFQIREAAAREIKLLRTALRSIRAHARFEYMNPTGLHMTCLAVIEKEVNQALGDPNLPHD